MPGLAARQGGTGRSVPLMVVIRHRYALTVLLTLISLAAQTRITRRTRG
ncbi:hypothetical protein MED15_00927 [Micromonospora noduli]|uniref:Uncharacterized protein n=1 Tax=Micromonospora noduli TaxID=709876 RepID=A0A328N780_9ACTN|nr:hypothetical protein LAH08_01709 [Micromonospora noduli]RAO25169.1 hypothetical protein MED15_00927 [Micromonospora noduli]